MKYMDALWYHADRQTDLLESISRQMSQLQHGRNWTIC